MWLVITHHWIGKISEGVQIWPYYQLSNFLLWNWLVITCHWIGGVCEGIQRWLIPNIYIFCIHNMNNCLWVCYVIKYMMFWYKIDPKTIVVYSCRCRCKQKHNDNFNEWTNTFLYKYIPLTFYSRKGWCFFCVRGELETETDCYILTQSFSDHSSTSFVFRLGCLTESHWGPKLSVWSWLSRWHLVPQLTPTAPGTDWLLELTDPSCLWHLVI